MSTQSRNYETFIKKYKLSMDAITQANFKKAHYHAEGALNSYYDYAYSLDMGQERLRAMRFGKELKALEKSLYERVESMKSLEEKVNSNSFLSGISGQDKAKEELMRLVIYPELYPDLYERFKKRKGGGILLYGVPGTGKTRIAQALAKDLDAHFIEVKCSDVICKWFGESERNIKDIFIEARKHPKSVIFFDEFESLGAVRGGDSNNPISRVISELLSQIQGFDNNNSNVFIMAATNRPWDIDSAFLRPGRFGSLVHVTLPNDESRLDIVKYELNGIMVSNDFDYDKIVKHTKGFSASDMVEFCERLKDRVIYRLIHNEGLEVITNDDIDVVLLNIKSSVSERDLSLIEDYINGKSSPNKASGGVSCMVGEAC